MKPKIGIVGLWHLGCVLSVSWAKLGYEVVSYDSSQSLIEGLQRGKAPLFEPEMDDLLKLANLKFSHNVQDLVSSDFVFLAIDTPVDEQDMSLTESLKNLVEQIAPQLKNECVLIVSSQCPVGLSRQLRAQLQSHNPSLELAYSPENLRLGQAISCYLRPGHIVLGTVTEKCQARCLELFGHLEAQIFPMSLESAEMVKHGINSFLAMSIVFANQMADLCVDNGADILEIVSAMKADPRIGARAYLGAGIGFSGGTLGRDLRVLSQVYQSQHQNSQISTGTDFFGTLWDLNAERYLAIITLLEKRWGRLDNQNIAVLGLTYKPDTSTLRQSIPLKIVTALQARGAKVTAYDPKADYTELTTPPTFGIADSVLDAVQGCDGIVLLTSWSEFRDYPWESIPAQMKSARFFDGQNWLLPQHRGLFEYTSIGRG
jgi:UDPglucose 6-dehydrogenase